MFQKSNRNKIRARLYSNVVLLALSNRPAVRSQFQRAETGTPLPTSSLVTFSSLTLHPFNSPTSHDLSLPSPYSLHNVFPRGEGPARVSSITLCVYLLLLFSHSPSAYPSILPPAISTFQHVWPFINSISNSVPNKNFAIGIDTFLTEHLQVMKLRFAL